MSKFNYVLWAYTGSGRCVIECPMAGKRRSDGRKVVISVGFWGKKLHRADRNDTLISTGEAIMQGMSAGCRE